MVKKDVSVAIILFALGIVTRIPFMSKVFYYWDCVNYALALDNYDVSLQQPAAPGYFLYIMLGRVFHLFIDNPNTCFVWISVIASGFGAMLLYVLGFHMFSKRIGVMASLLFITSPLVWFHGEIAFAYVLEGTLSVLLALLCYQTLRTRRLRWSIIGALVLAGIGGIRPQGMVLLFPLWFFGCWRLAKKELFISFTTFGCCVLAWFVPMVVMTGGLRVYFQAFQSQGAILAFDNLSQFLVSLFENTEKYIRYLLKALTGGLVLLFVGIKFLPKKKLNILKDHASMVLLVWILFPTLFFILIYVGNPGHIFTCLFAFFLLIALIIEKLSSVEKRRWGGLLALCITVNILAFVVDFDPHRSWYKKTWYQAADLRKKDQFVLNKIQYIKNNFNPAHTIILADTGGSGHLPQLAYYLPVFRSYSFAGLKVQNANNVVRSNPDRTLSHIGDVAAFVLDKTIKRIVLFDSRYIKAIQTREGQLYTKSLKDSVVLHWVELLGDETIEIAQGRLLLN